MMKPELIEELLSFRRERDWERFHTPRNLCAAISVESAELLEHFRWSLDDGAAAEKPRLEDLSHEIADVVILLTYLAHDLGIDIGTSVSEKLRINEIKYPVEKSRGRSVKYDQLD